MELFLKVMNARAAAGEPLVREKQTMEFDVGLDAFAGEFGKRYAHAGKCLLACITVGDELADHTVVIGRNRIAAKTCESMRMPGPPGRCQAVTLPGQGTKVKGSSALMRHSMA